MLAAVSPHCNAFLAVRRPADAATALRRHPAGRSPAPGRGRLHRRGLPRPLRRERGLVGPDAGDPEPRRPPGRSGGLPARRVAALRRALPRCAGRAGHRRPHRPSDSARARRRGRPLRLGAAGRGTPAAAAARPPPRRPRAVAGSRAPPRASCASCWCASGSPPTRSPPPTRRGCPQDAAGWGRYYEHDPVVVAGDLARGLASLERHRRT